jgi:hypothetical protein
MHDIRSNSPTWLTYIATSLIAGTFISLINDSVFLLSVYLEITLITPPIIWGICIFKIATASAPFKKIK